MRETSSQICEVGLHTCMCEDRLRTFNIIGLVGEASSLGFIHLLGLTAMISINLAGLNLLPFPALDGGRLLLVSIEYLKGFPIKPSVTNAINAAGFGLLLFLMLLVTYSDILKLSSG